MKKQRTYLAVFAFMALVTFGCTNTATDEVTEEVAEMVEPDMAAVKAEIQAMENAWAKAQTDKDVEGLLAMYSDDAISMADGKPSVSGREALRVDIEANMASRPEGQVTAFETTEVYGIEDQVTEIGISTSTDAAGNVIETGKYMAIWEKRDGKYVCIRDIYNQDAPKK